MANELSGKRVAVLVAPRGTEEPEFSQPYEALQRAGAEVVVLGLEQGEAQTVNHDLDPGGGYQVDSIAGDVSSHDLDGIVIPGGTVGADKLRADDAVVDLVAKVAADGGVVASICHGPWTLVEAGIVDGRTVTSYPSLATDLRNAGADWVDREVAVDGNLITSRQPDDLPAFCDALVSALRG